MTGSSGVDRSEFWTRMEARGPETVQIGETVVGRGSRVRLRPRTHVDVVDLALDGQVAVVAAVEQDEQGELHLAVTLEADPGRDLGDAKMPGHRFFYSVADVEPIPPGSAVGDSVAGPRILVAGIGNMFLGDDGFGVAAIRRLAERPGWPGVDVVEFGIRGMDLVYALQRGYDAAVFVDAAPRGQPPGTLTLLEPRQAWDGQPAVETHGMDPVQVLRLAQELGPVPDRLLVLCCEPATVRSGAPDEDVLVELSPPVHAAVAQAVSLIECTVNDLLSELAAVRQLT